ncbi:MAG: hypothetical protein AB7F65_00970 [Dehalococcoidia bacterium]
MRRASAAPIALLAACALLVACAQAPATTDFGTPAPVATSSGAAPVGPTLGTIPVWLSEHGILLWTPAVAAAGTYAFEIENIGRQAHDFIVVRARSIESIEVRSDRAQLQDERVIARSPVLQPDQATTMYANLSEPGTYVVLSSQGQDFGRGMASIVTVAGAPGGRVDPLPTPPPDDSETIAAYLVDRAIFLHEEAVNAGIVSFNVQNIGPSEHDFVVIQWRGDPTALPVDEAGNVLLDSLIILDRLPPIPPGEAAMLEVELEEEFAYVVLSSLPGDYAAGMSAQVVPR